MNTNFLQQIRPFIVMDVMEKAAALEKQGRRVFHLEVGQPSTGAPEAVILAVEAALRADKLGYTSARGLPGFRQAISDYYEKIEGISVNPDRIIATAGSSAGFVLSLIAALPPRARVGIPEPGYPCYRNILLSLGHQPVTIPCGVETGYQFTAAALDEFAGNIDALIVANPANPTGTALGFSQVNALVQYCKEKSIVLISDEVYNRVYYETRPESVLRFSDEAIVVNSFSKYYSMTGWRIGWTVLPENLVRSTEKLSQNLYIAPSTLSQIAAIASFSAEAELQKNVLRYQSNRDSILEGLRRAGLSSYAPPHGGFYIYVDASSITRKSTVFCQRLLEETGVAITPGEDFDTRVGHKTIRFSYSGNSEDVKEATNLFAEFCRNYSEY